MRLLESANREADKLKDEFISVEHILLAITDDIKTQAGSILKQHGATRDQILRVLTQIRGKQRVTSQDPEATLMKR